MNGLHLWLIPVLPFVGFPAQWPASVGGCRKAVVSAIALLFTAAPLLMVLHVYTSFSALSLPYVERLGSVDLRPPSSMLTLPLPSISSRWSCCW